MEHVDVVKNEWLAGYQLVVARLRLEQDALAVDVVQEPVWTSVVKQSFHDAESGKALTPDEPREFFYGLHAVMKGDYLFATPAHEESECPYHAMVIPLEPADASRQPQAV
jgi:hypothetical protein